MKARGISAAIMNGIASGAMYSATQSFALTITTFVALFYLGIIANNTQELLKK